MDSARDETSALLRRAQAGERNALDELYRRCVPRLLAIVRVRLGGGLRARLEGQDIVQSALMRSFEHLDEFRGTDTAALLSWLVRIAENEIHDRADFHGRQKRGAGREVRLEIGQDVRAERLRSALSEVILDEQSRRLEDAVGALPEEQREVVLLRRFEELSFAEIGERMGRSEDAARMLLARAMAALSVAMGKP